MRWKVGGCCANVNCAPIKFLQLSLWWGRRGHRQRLVAGRQQSGEQSCFLAQPLGLPGVVGRWEVSDSDAHRVCTTSVVTIYCKSPLAALFAWRWWLNPPPQYFQAIPCLVFVCAEIMKNYFSFFLKECIISLNNLENTVIYLSAVTGFAHPMSNFVIPHHHPSCKWNGQGHPLLSPQA